MKKTFHQICLEHGTDKVSYHGYHYFYPLFLENLREEEFTMLEIGYSDGCSVKSWYEYFEKAQIYAADINVSGDEQINDRCRVLKADQSNQDDLNRILSEIKSAKFIIDDGSHVPLHQMDTFVFLFTNLLEKGGVYIIEDIETNYWRPDALCYGYKIGNFSVMENMRKFHEMINHQFTGVNNTLDISSITYGQNCIIIKKRTEEESEYFTKPYRFAYQQ